MQILNYHYYCYGQSLSDVNGSRLIQLNDCTCIGYTQLFECTVFGGFSTIWRSSAFAGCQRNEIQLRHSRYVGKDQPRGECNNGAIVAKGIGVSDGQYTSQLNITFTKDNFMINDSEAIIIECAHSEGNQTVPINQLLITQG